MIQVALWYISKMMLISLLFCVNAFQRLLVTAKAAAFTEHSCKEQATANTMTLFEIKLMMKCMMHLAAEASNTLTLSCDECDRSCIVLVVKF